MSRPAMHCAWALSREFLLWSHTLLSVKRVDTGPRLEVCDHCNKNPLRKRWSLLSSWWDIISAPGTNKDPNRLGQSVGSLGPD